MTAAEFNKLCPAGTDISYFPVLGSFQHVRTKTRSKAWPLASGEVIVAIEGKAGGVSIAHITVDGPGGGGRLERIETEKGTA